jgi:hypothetical protein
MSISIKVIHEYHPIGLSIFQYEVMLKYILIKNLNYGFNCN